MPRKDVEKLVSWMRSDKKAYFMKGMRDLRNILPASIRAHDKLTAEELVRETVGAFWYWDKRVPRVKNWKKAPKKEELESFVADREDMRGRRDEIMALLMLAKEASDHAVSGGHEDKKRKGFALKIGAMIDDCEREWGLVAAKRIAEGEMGGKWIVRIS